MTDRKKTYDNMASTYERMVDRYSRGAIPKAKLSQVEEMSPGDRVLYVGVGPGSDAVAASRKGAKVTCVDLSSRMLDEVRGKLRRESLDAELVHSDLFDYTAPSGYDVVCANFLLDCFGVEEMRNVLAHIKGLVRPGGKLLIAEVGIAPRGLPSRILFHAYHGLPFLVSWVQGLTPFHPIYDYAAELRSLGFRVTKRQPYPVWDGGPELFQTVVGVRAEAEGCVPAAP